MRFLTRLGPYLIPGLFVLLVLILIIVPLVDQTAYDRVARRLSEAVPRLLAWTTWWPAIAILLLIGVIRWCAWIGNRPLPERAHHRTSVLVAIVIGLVGTAITAWVTWLRVTGQAPQPILERDADLMLVWVVLGILWAVIAAYQTHSLSPVWFTLPALRGVMRRRLTASLQSIARDNTPPAYAIIIESRWMSVPATLDLIDHRDAADAALVAVLRALLGKPGLPDSARAQLFAAIARMGMPPDERPGLLLTPARC
jgi:hypothetical protein